MVTDPDASGPTGKPLNARAARGFRSPRWKRSACRARNTPDSAATPQSPLNLSTDDFPRPLIADVLATISSGLYLFTDILGLPASLIHGATNARYAHIRGRFRAGSTISGIRDARRCWKLAFGSPSLRRLWDGATRNSTKIRYHFSKSNPVLYGFRKRSLESKGTWPARLFTRRGGRQIIRSVRVESP